MTAFANVKPDVLQRGVEVHLGRARADGSVVALGFNALNHEVPAGQEPPRSCGLNLTEDMARALYEALAEHFGHSGHDTRALRRDYDAERKRVDTFISHLTGGSK